ncbi:phage tail tape measure protein [Parageobacillus toebii]|uniref:phage tail tape measure protein n=1 Tax=Parageobacillus toebii TaxID=153151 RepID=UPI002E1B72CF|nr:phage tail tape measure protein [Parageobacillus toebii]MED4969745.1 phage tail tape measure protein [Parageobacillus toebii]
MAESVRGINVVIGADTTKLGKALEDVNKKSRDIQSELRQVERLLRFDPSNTTLLAQKQQLLSKAIENTSEKLNRLKSVQQQVNEQFRRGEISEGQYRAFQREIEKTEGQLRTLQSRLEETNGAINKHTTVWGRLQERLSTVGNNFRDIGQRMQSVGQSMAASFGAATAAIGGALGFAVKKSMDFEAQIDRVGAVAGATPAEIKKLEKAALDLGASTSKSATEVAKGMEIMAAMGYNTNQILAAMPGIIAAAEASGEDMALVADTVSSALNSFGLAASEASRVADVLAQAANDSAAGIQDMQYTFKYAAPVAKSLGISLEQLAAATEIMSNAGIRGEQAGTTLRAALIRLSDPPKEAANTLERLGVKITDANGKMLPFSNIIGQLAEKTKNMSNAQKLAALSTIFGTEAASGMLTVVEAGPQKLDQLTKSLQNSAGASQEAAKKMKDNLKGSLEELQGAFETAQITIGNALAPAIQKIAEALQGLINWFNNLSPSMQQFIAIGAAVAVAITGIVAAIGVVLAVIGGAVSGFGALAAAIGAISAPVAIAVAAIAGLGIGVAVLVNHFKQSSIEVDLFGNKVSEATQKAVGGFLKLNDQATVALNQLAWSGQVVTQNIANNIISTFDQMGDQVLSAMQQDHQAQLTQMQNFFAQSSALTEQEEQKALAKLQQHQQQEQQTIQQGQQRIAEILNTAKEQKRAITDAERQEINRIQQQMVETGIQYLSQNELEAKSILERMKAQAGELTAQQAAEVVKNSKKQKDEAIKAANEQYNNVVKEIIRQRDEVGSITKEQADKLIQEATRQRDEAVKKATDMHNKVVEEAKKQAGEHVNQVNWETGQVLSKWEVFKNDMQSKWETIKTNTKNKLIEMGNDIKSKYEEMKNTARDKFENMKKAVSEKMAATKAKIEEIWNQAKSFLEGINLYEIGRNIIQGLIDGISSMAQSVYKKAQEIANKVKETIQSALGIHSPSLVMKNEVGKWIPLGLAEGIEKNINAVIAATKRMAQAAIPNVAGYSGAVVPATATINVPKMAGAKIEQHFHFHSTAPTPSEVARKNLRVSRQLAMEWGL